MRRHAFAGFALCVVAALLACVGDNPDTAAPATGSDGGNDNGNDGAPASSDAGPETETGGDAGAPPCALDQPFGPATKLAEVETGGSEMEARLTPDELSIYYWTRPRGDGGSPVVLSGYHCCGGDLVLATRTSRDEPFGAPSLSLLPDTASSERDPTITGNNLTLYYASDAPPGDAAHRHIWRATRGVGTGAFGTGENVTTLNTGGDDSTPYVMPDDLTLFFSSDVGLVRATRPPNGTFSIETAQTFAAVNTGTGERNPVVSVDELTLYFASLRGGGSGSTDIWKATRASKSDPFGSIVNVAELNTADLELPTWLSPDGCRLYFDRSGLNTNDFSTYVAKKPPK